MSLQPYPPIVPGVYVNGKAQLLRAGEQAFLIQNQVVTTPQATVAVQLERIKAAQVYPFGASFEISFNANPGVFEVDIQTADTDIDGNYVTINVINSGLNSNNVGRLELPLFWARYVRGKIITLTNPNIQTSILVTR